MTRHAVISEVIMGLLLSCDAIHSLEETMSALEYVRLTTPTHGSFQMAVDPKSNDPIAQALLSGQHSVPLAIQVLLAGIRPGATILDLGAHIGTFSITAAAMGYHVIAVEASPRNCELLRASADINGFKQLQVVFSAASDHQGTLQFFENGPFGVVNTERFAPSGSFEVPTTTIDALVDDLAIADKVAFIKMDIEGSEPAALQGMPRLLSRTSSPAIFYESNGHVLDLFAKAPRDLVEALQRHGYQSYLVSHNRLTPIDSDYQQLTCVVDNLAVKSLTGAWGQWPIRKQTVEEQIQDVLAAASSPVAAVRIYLARSLGQATPNVLRDRRVVDALSRLRQDSDPAVGQALGWISDEALP